MISAKQVNDREWAACEMSVTLGMSHIRRSSMLSTLFLFVALLAYGGGQIRWDDGTWDCSGVPQGVLLSDNRTWYGSHYFTGVTNCGIKGLTDYNGVPCLSCRQYDFRVVCIVREIDISPERFRGMSGEVAFSTDGKVWTGACRFSVGAKYERIRFAEGVETRYLRVMMAAPAKVPEEGFQEDVFVWGNVVDESMHPERIVPIPAGQALKFSDAVGGKISILPMSIPHLDRKPSGCTPGKYKITMSKDEVESRYFSIVNGGCELKYVNVAAPALKSGLTAELLIGGVVRTSAPKRKLSERERVQLATTDENGINTGSADDLDVLPFFFRYAKPPKNFCFKYLANPRQVDGFPERIPLQPGEGCVVMMRIKSQSAMPGVHVGELKANDERLPIEIRVVDWAMPPQQMRIYSWLPFTKQRPFESAERFQRDVERYSEMGAGSTFYLPEPGTKEEAFFRLHPDAYAGVEWWCDKGLYWKVRHGEYEKLTEKEKESMVSSARKFVKRAKELGIMKGHASIMMPDEPDVTNARSVMQLAKLLKTNVPEIVIESDPLFFDGKSGFNSDQTVLDNLLPEYNQYVDISIPIMALAESRPVLMAKLWTKKRLYNAQYAHPAGKTGREAAYSCFRCGFNGLTYFCYYLPCGSDPWDIRTWSPLNFDYQVVFALENDVALTPLYETLRETAEDCRMLTALKAAGKNDLLQSLLERAKSAWDRTHFQYKLKDSAAEDILALRERILQEFDANTKE